MARPGPLVAGSTISNSLSSLHRPTESDFNKKLIGVVRSRFSEINYARRSGSYRALSDSFSTKSSLSSVPQHIVNSADNHCDALIVRAHVDQVIHVPFPNVTFQRCTGFQNIIMLESLLIHARVLPCGDSDKEGKV